MSPAKIKDTWGSWRNRPYAAGDDKKRQVAEAFESLNAFVRKHGGSITSPPGRCVRIEAPKGSTLPDELQKLGFNVVSHGSVSRVTGVGRVSPADEFYNATPSPFAEYLLFEVTLGGKK
jgi:hypothetical protein